VAAGFSLRKIAQPKGCGDVPEQFLILEHFLDYPTFDF
jgi:hypothetical protein